MRARIVDPPHETGRPLTDFKPGDIVTPTAYASFTPAMVTGVRGEVTGFVWLKTGKNDSNALAVPLPSVLGLWTYCGHLIVDDGKDG